jgi:hypothetical protein
MFAHQFAQRASAISPVMTERVNSVRLGIRRTCNQNQLFEDQFFEMMAALKDRLGPRSSQHTYNITLGGVVHYGVTADHIGFSDPETYGDAEISPEGSNNPCGCTWWETTFAYRVRQRGNPVLLRS